MKNSKVYEIKGRLIDIKSNRPLLGLQIRAYDKDIIFDDCLGSDKTNEQGDFEISFFEHDFKEPFEEQPEVYVVIYGPDMEQLHCTKPIRLEPGQYEVYLNILIDAGPLLTDPRVSEVIPSIVLPGTFVDIYGDNFGDIYKNVMVSIGGREAVVLSVNPQKIKIRIPAEPGSLNPLVISIAGKTIELNDVFTADTQPDEGTVGHLGAPTTFSGSAEGGAGLDSVGENQRVLIVMCYPSDKNPTDGGETAADERQRQIDTFENLVNPGFRQMSYGCTDFDFDYTDWLALPEDDDFYFWRNADIVAAQDDIDNLPADATEEEIDAANAALETAQNGQNLMQRGVELYHDALKAAQDGGRNLADYKGIMLCMATDWLRGQASGTWDEVTDSDGHTVTLAPSTYLWVIAYNAHWGRRIHELSHAIASPDLYGRTGYISDGSRWDMMGNHNHMPLFSGYNMLDRLDWYDNPNVQFLDWTSTPHHDQVYTLRAHDASKDTLATTYHIIKIDIFPGLTYYVEVRQEPDALPADLDTTSDSLAVLAPAAAASSADPTQILFDTNIDFPAAAPAHKGGVIVTKVVDDDSQLNQNFRYITLLSPELMQAGEEVVDAARRLTIRVESKTNDRPLTYQVRVKWVEVATADPSGLLNLRVRPWDSSYQTNDIWVDSEANGWGTYETALEPATGNPLGNGDRPWVNHSNRLYTRVHNFGVVEATDVQVTFYVNSPPAVGDSGTWVPMTVKTIPSIAPGSSEAIYTPWTPAEGEHTCLKVAVETQLGETDVNDNSAQENVFNFDTSGASPHEPILLEVNLQNPKNEWTHIQMHPQGIPAGWEVTVEHGWVWLPPLGTKKMQLALFTDKGRERPLTRYFKNKDDNKRIPNELKFKLEGATYTWYGKGKNVHGQAEHLASTGGISINARARRKVDIALKIDREVAKVGILRVQGAVEPELGDVQITLEIAHEKGRHKVVQLKTNQNGRFDYDSGRYEHYLTPGLYSIQAFTINDPVVADTKSEIVSVELERVIIR
ncbi:MAG: IPT/TIG domain-containing protein [Candidatus Electrothrix sp. YB6]